MTALKVHGCLPGRDGAAGRTRAHSSLPNHGGDFAGAGERPYVQSVHTPSPTVPRQVLRLVEDLSGRLAERFGGSLKDVQLTGAHARGIATPTSEIKVVVLLERAGFSEHHDVLNVVGDLLAETGLLISAQVFDPTSYRAHLAPRASLRPVDDDQRVSSLPPRTDVDAIEGELTVAREELAASRHLSSHGLHRIAISRLYFAVFRAARAMLYTQGFEPTRHAKLLTVFSGSLIRPGHCDRSCSRVLTRLHAFRGRADDGDPFPISEAEADREWRDAAGFVALAEEFTRSRN